MKKSFLIIFMVVILLVVTGCGNNQVKCSGEYNESNVNIVADIIADLDKDDKVASAKMIFDLKDDESANLVCDTYKKLMEEKDGVTVTCSGSKITIDGYTNLDKELLGVSKEEFIKGMESQKFTCK